MVHPLINRNEALTIRSSTLVHLKDRGLVSFAYLPLLELLACQADVCHSIVSVNCLKLS